MTESVNIQETNGRSLTVGLPGTKVLTDPELAAFRSWLNLNQHNHPEPAKPFAYNMIEQIQNYLAGDFARGAFGALFGYQLRQFVLAGGVPPAH